MYRTMFVLVGITFSMHHPPAIGKSRPLARRIPVHPPTSAPATRPAKSKQNTKTFQQEKIHLIRREILYVLTETDTFFLRVLQVKAQQIKKDYPKNLHAAAVAVGYDAALYKDDSRYRQFCSKFKQHLAYPFSRYCRPFALRQMKRNYFFPKRVINQWRKQKEVHLQTKTLRQLGLDFTMDWLLLQTSWDMLKKSVLKAKKAFPKDPWYQMYAILMQLPYFAKIPQLDLALKHLSKLSRQYPRILEIHFVIGMTARRLPTSHPKRAALIQYHMQHLSKQKMQNLFAFFYLFVLKNGQFQDSVPFKSKKQKALKVASQFLHSSLMREPIVRHTWAFQLVAPLIRNWMPLNSPQGGLSSKVTVNPAFPKMVIPLIKAAQKKWPKDPSILALQALLYIHTNQKKQGGKLLSKLLQQGLHEDFFLDAFTFYWDLSRKPKKPKSSKPSKAMLFESLYNVPTPYITPLSASPLKPKEAKRLLQILHRVLHKRPANTWARFYRAKTYLRIGRKKAAIRELRYLLQHPGTLKHVSSNFPQELIQMYRHDLKNPKAVIPLLKRYSKTNASEPELQQTVLKLALKHNKPKLAHTCLQRVLRIRGCYPTYYTQAAETYIRKLKQPLLLLPAVQGCFAKKQKDLFWLRLRLKLHTSAGHFKGIKADLLELIRRQPTRTKHYLAYIRRLNQKKMYQKALAQLKTWQKTVKKPQKLQKFLQVAHQTQKNLIQQLKSLNKRR